MRRFQISRSSTEFFTSHSGLALVGLALERHTGLAGDLQAVGHRHGVSRKDNIASSLF